MKKFKNCTVVRVIRDAGGKEVNANGTIARLRRGDDGAWISLFERSPTAYHPFPADDEGGRGNHILAYPEDCEKVS